MKSSRRCRMWALAPAALIGVLGLSIDATGAQSTAVASETAAHSIPALSDPASMEVLIREMIATAAEADGRVPVALALAIARVESNFDANAESPVGARGVMQIMPATARNEYGIEPETLWDAQTNIELGVRFLGDLYESYGRDWDAALSHYNGGTLKNSRPHAFTVDYVTAVKRWWRTYDSRSPLQRHAANSPAVTDCGCSKSSLGAAPRGPRTGAETAGDSRDRVMTHMTQEELIDHIAGAKARVRAALEAQGAYD